MRKILLPLFGLLLFAFPSLAHAEQIDSFDVRIAVGTDRSVQVEETIRYDFENEERRGIYRDIPYVYDGEKMDIEILSVTDAAGKPWKYDVSRSGGFIRVKIGDADTYLTGKQDYEIAYRVEEAVLFFDDHEELYWNATGDGWGIPIMAASAEVVFPAPSTKSACYVGERGSRDEKRCSIQTIGQTVRYAVRNPNADATKGAVAVPALAPGEGLTVVAAVAKGTIMPMTETERWLRWVGKYWPLILPLITLATMAWLWNKKGRDPETGRHVAPMYDAPDELSPAEVGVVWDEDADRHDISATLIDLAVRGYLKVRETEDQKLLVLKSKDYIFTRLKTTDEGLRPFEKTLLEGIFDSGDEKKLSELKEKFAKTYERTRSQLFAAVTAGKYFLSNPRHVRNAYYGGAGGLLIAGVVLGVLTENFILGFAIGLCGIILAIFAARMPQRTMKGVEAKVHIAGLKLYLQRAEKKQIEFHNAPAKKPETFEKLLPYAMALRVEEAWAKEFEDIYTEPPSWYQSSTPGNFHLGYMMGSLHSFTHAAEAALPATPSGGSGSSGFGGGGFSGGGFGGGGGGSW